VNFKRLLKAFKGSLLLCITFAVLTVAQDLAYAQKNQPFVDDPRRFEGEPRSSSTQYIFPLNASIALPRATSIIIRPGPILDAATVTSSLLTVSGSFSGNHSGTFQLSDDTKTLVFTPAILFTYGERVTVKLASGIRVSTGALATGALVDPVSFYFTIQSKAKSGTTDLFSSAPGSPLQGAKIGHNPDYPKGVALPAPYPTPQFIKTIIDNPTPGAIILAPYFAAAHIKPDTSYLSIINDSGKVLWGLPSLNELQDFKLNPDGRYSYFDEKVRKFFLMDSTLTIVDSLQCAGGYRTDFHDIEFLPHNHALMLGFDTDNDVDLSQYVAGGNRHAIIIDVVVMEIDSLKNPIFIWRSRDTGGYTLSDMIEFPLGLKLPPIDAVHANTVFKDTDGNIVLSSRHLDEITKISYDSAKIMWRFGGKHNQFTLIGDSIWFSHQHHVRRIANGDFTLFDNGNDRSYHRPPAGNYSRACEYQLDEQAMTAKLVWQFDEGKTDTSTSQGSVQRLKNGNTFICWGENNYFSSFGPAMTEVRPDGSIAFELSLAFPYVTYRAFRLPANTPGFTDAVSHTLYDVTSGVTLSIPYPNPCSGFSSMTVALPSNMTVDMRIYDALGHEVSRIASGMFAAGAHNVGLGVAGLPDGVYHCVLRTESGTVARKIVVAK
jgi:hypothetical protein